MWKYAHIESDQIVSQELLAFVDADEDALMGQQTAEEFNMAKLDHGVADLVQIPKRMMSSTSDKNLRWTHT